MAGAACKVIFDQGEGLIGDIKCAESGISLSETSAIQATLAGTVPELSINQAVATKLADYLTEVRATLGPMLKDLVIVAPP